MKDETPALSISENHRRGIATTLGLLDETLCRFAPWAHGSEAHGVLYEERNSLTAGQREQLLATIASIREVMKSLRDDLKLDKRLLDVRTTVWSESSSRWEALVELGTGHLKRYGDMPAGFAEYLDPKVEAIIQLLRRFSELSD
jgi:hypothetical protein